MGCLQLCGFLFALINSNEDFQRGLFSFTTRVFIFYLFLSLVHLIVFFFLLVGHLVEGAYQGHNRKISF